MSCEQGYTDKEKMGESSKQADNRKQTGDNSGQRPVMTSNKVKTDKGSFTFKG